MERAQNFRIAFHIHNVDHAVIIYTQLCLRNPHRNSEPFPIARMPEDGGDKISRAVPGGSDPFCRRKISPVSRKRSSL